MKKAILAVLVVAICGCNGTGVLPESNNSSSIGKSPIEPGTYSGTITVKQEINVNGTPTEDTSQGPVSIDFGSSGLPIYEGNREVYIGSKHTETYGDIKITEKVTDITATENGLTISFDVTFDFSGVPVKGHGTDTYKKIDDTSIAYNSELGGSFIDQTVGYEIFTFTITANGTLSK